ncbi:MAG TPA: hypothetical protein VF339_05920 [Gammaproteobacteria bacterium]
MRIVLGLWLLQAFSAGSAWLVLSGGSRSEVLVWIALMMSVGLLAALWFWTALRDQRRLGEARQLERVASREAALHADLARQRAADTAKLRALTEKASRPQRRLLTVSLVAGGALGLCAALIVSQLVTLGLLVAAFAAGGGTGYVLRGRLARGAASAAEPVVTVTRSRRGKPVLGRAGLLLLGPSKAKAA